MEKKIKTPWVMTALILLIALSVFWIMRQATAPRETIRDPIKNPPAEVLRGGASKM